MRHGYYLKRKCYAYSGTKEFTVKKLGSKENRKRKTCMKTERKKHQGPGWPDDPDGGPDDPDPGPDDPANSTEHYRSLPPEAGSSGPRPGSSGPCPDVRTASRTSGPVPPPAESPDHPGLHPDHPDQPGSSDFGPGTSGQRLCARVGLSPCTPSPP